MVKLRSIQYNENELPEEVTVTLTVSEAAFIHQLTGRLTGDASNAVMPKGDVIGHEIFSCVSNVFNRHWDDGVSGFLRGDDE